MTDDRGFRLQILDFGLRNSKAKGREQGVDGEKMLNPFLQNYPGFILMASFV
jgi:hypothetical protein